MNDRADEDVMRDTRQAVISARRAVYEAQRALDRAEMQFKLAGIDPDELLQRFEKDADPVARQEFDRFVAEAMAQMAVALNPATIQSNLADSGSSAPRKIRFHV